MNGVWSTFSSRRRNASGPSRWRRRDAETPRRRFGREYVQRVTTLTEALDELDSSVRTEEQRGAWIVTGRDTSDRGVSIRLTEMSQSVAPALRNELPDGDHFPSLWDWSDAPAGRLLMVDREQTLVSVLVVGDGNHPPEPRDETAIWGRERRTAVVLRAPFTWQLDADRE